MKTFSDALLIDARSSHQTSDDHYVNRDMLATIRTSLTKMRLTVVILDVGQVRSTEFWAGLTVDGAQLLAFDALGRLRASGVPPRGTVATGFDLRLDRPEGRSGSDPVVLVITRDSEPGAGDAGELFTVIDSVRFSTTPQNENDPAAETDSLLGIMDRLRSSGAAAIRLPVLHGAPASPTLRLFKERDGVPAGMVVETLTTDQVTLIHALHQLAVETQQDDRGFLVRQILRAAGKGGDFGDLTRSRMFADRAMCLVASLDDEQLESAWYHFKHRECIMFDNPDKVPPMTRFLRPDTHMKD